MNSFKNGRQSTLRQIKIDDLLSCVGVMAKLALEQDSRESDGRFGVDHGSCLMILRE